MEIPVKLLNAPFQIATKVLFTHCVTTLVKKPLCSLKVCTRVQSSEMTKFHDIFEDQKIDKMDIIFCHDPQIAKCKNQFHLYA